MLFALRAICFKLTAVRQTKTEEFQICCGKSLVEFQDLLPLDLNLGLTVGLNSVGFDYRGKIEMRDL